MNNHGHGEMHMVLLIYENALVWWGSILILHFVH
jgi:hypothetical protein